MPPFRYNADITLMCIGQLQPSTALKRGCSVFATSLSELGHVWREARQKYLA